MRVIIICSCNLFILTFSFLLCHIMEQNTHNIIFMRSLCSFQYLWLNSCRSFVKKNYEYVFVTKYRCKLFINHKIQETSLCVLLNKLFNMEERRTALDRALQRAIQFTSPLDHTQNHRLCSELLSALAWLNVTDNCLLSHNTSWAHRRGTLGFPPEAARRTEQNVIKRHEKRRTAAWWALPLVVDGGLLLVLWPGGAKAHDNTELEFSLRKS